MTRWQPGKMQGPVARPGLGSARVTPGRYNEDMEQLIFRLHQVLIEELDSEQISAMPADERRKVVEQAAQTVLRREVSRRPPGRRSAAVKARRQSTS